MGDEKAKNIYHSFLVHEEMLGLFVRSSWPMELQRLSVAFMSNMAQIGVPMKDKTNYHPI